MKTLFVTDTASADGLELMDDRVTVISGPRWLITDVNEFWSSWTDKDALEGFSTDMRLEVRMIFSNVF